jgi:two-component system, NtrC family, sensor kinase
VNDELKKIQDLIANADVSSEDILDDIGKAIKSVERSFSILEFKHFRLKKEHRATEVLLDETIKELQEKRRGIEEANESLQQALKQLQDTQQQLVFAEKMASLGQLTSGVAHEIQNPLNFVNNFSSFAEELTQELITELRSLDVNKLVQAEKDTMLDTLHEIREVQMKILEHGTRADEIVKNMILHSRSGRGSREDSDLNSIISEALDIAYQGIRTEYDDFSCEFKQSYADDLPLLSLVAQDISRVCINVFGNAFYSMHQKQCESGEEYKPELRITTSIDENTGVIHIRDNGLGIPDELHDNIFTPFFTTKPAGKGTGLGLSLAFDMIKSNGGELTIESENGIFFEIIIHLPLATSLT